MKNTFLMGLWLVILRKKGGAYKAQKYISLKTDVSNNG